MPRYKRYAPVSHEINSDAELWEFTNLFGDRSIRLWLEILIILDKTGNSWKLTANQWDDVLARKLKLSKQTVRAAVSWLIDKGWLNSSVPINELIFEKEDERAVEEKFFEQLNDSSARRQVKVETGIIDILTDTAIYEIKLKLYRWAIMRGIGQLLSYHPCFPNHRLILVGASSPHLRQLRPILARNSIDTMLLHSPERSLLTPISLLAPNNVPIVSAPNYDEYHRKRGRKSDNVGTDMGTKREPLGGPPSLPLPSLPPSSSLRKEEEGDTHIFPDLGLGEKHPGNIVGWELWQKLEKFWRSQLRPLSIFQIEMLSKQLIELKQAGRDPVEIVERTLRAGWLHLHADQDNQNGKADGGAVIDFGEIRARAQAAAAGAKSGE